MMSLVIHEVKMCGHNEFPVSGACTSPRQLPFDPPPSFTRSISHSVPPSHPPQAPLVKLWAIKEYCRDVLAEQDVPRLSVVGE